MDQELHDKLVKMYETFVEDESIIYVGNDITSRKEFIEHVGKQVGYRNIKELVKECNSTIKPKLEKQLDKLQTQINKIQRQLDIIK